MANKTPIKSNLFLEELFSIAVSADSVHSEWQRLSWLWPPPFSHRGAVGWRRVGEAGSLRHGCYAPLAYSALMGADHAQ